MISGADSWRLCILVLVVVATSIRGKGGGTDWLASHPLLIDELLARNGQNPGGKEWGLTLADKYTHPNWIIQYTAVTLHSSMSSVLTENCCQIV